MVQVYRLAAHAAINDTPLSKLVPMAFFSVLMGIILGAASAGRIVMAQAYNVEMDAFHHGFYL